MREGFLLSITFPGGILPVVSLPTARKRPNATAYATALQTKRIQRKLLACQKNVNLNETGNGGRNCTSLELGGEATTKQYYFC